jgi:hypothetical protein
LWIAAITFDIGAAPDFATDQAAAFGFLVGARYRAERDPKIIGEVAHRRQLRFGVEVAFVNGFGDGICDLNVLGSTAPTEFRHPTCHHNNKPIVLIFLSIL